jgi:hypothetical protein
MAARPWIGGTAFGPWQVLMGWFLAVPLLGAVWVPLLDEDGRIEAVVGRASPLGGATPARRRGRRMARSRDAALWLLTALIGTGLAALLGADVAGLVTFTVLGMAVRWMLRRKPAGGLGLTRGFLEVGVPLVIGWLAMGGPRHVPAPVGVTEGWGEMLRQWWLLNGALPAVAVAFTLVHHASMRSPEDANSMDLSPPSSSVRRPTPSDAPYAAGHPGVADATFVPAAGRRLQLGLGYLGAVVALAYGGHVLAAGWVGLLYVLQWPYQAVLSSGAVRWHCSATQWFAMAALLGAALAV